MALDTRTLARIVSLIGLVILIAVQVLSWRDHGRLNSGAFLLLIPILGPLFAGRQRSRT